MSLHRYGTAVIWQRKPAEKFSDNRYSRAHRWRFDGGLEVAASSSPLNVPLPLSDAAAVDPEEAFVAALASCHMLFFLSYAASAGYVIDEYEDQPQGLMGPDAEGRTAMLTVTLRPRVRWQNGRAPGAEDHDALHERAHRDCFLANSVRCDVRVEPRD